MSLRFGSLLAASTLFVFLPAAGNAQPSASSFKIELKSEQPVMPTYLCQLDEYATHQRFGMEDVRADGACNFRNVPYGDYRLSVLDARNTLVYEETVTVSQHGPPIVVELPKSEESKPPSGPVSMSQLQHPPTRKAFSAMVLAQHYSEAGDYRHAAEQLEKAVSLSPDYANARWNLAVQYIRLGEFDRSVEESRRAMLLDKPGAMQLCNLAYAQIQLKQFPEALESLHAALRLDGNYAQAHLVLGTLLARDWRTLPESIPHLELAAKSIPSAEAMLEMARKDLRKRKAQNAQQAGAADSK